MKHFSSHVLTPLLTVFICAWSSLLFAADAWQSPLQQDHPLVGRFVTVDGNSLSYAALLAKLRQAQLLLVGEKHDNPDHHQLEARLLRDLVDSDTAVVFEMLDDRHAPPLLELLRARQPSALTMDGLKQALNWSEEGWLWRDYGPLFRQVLLQGGELVAGNIDRSLMLGIYSHGLVSLGAQQLQSGARFGSVAAVQALLQESILDLVFDSHCGKMPKQKLQPMMQIQLAKDASMAFALTSADTPKRILIAGGVHARKDVGVPRHLPTDSLTLMMVEVQAGKFDPRDYPALTAGQADIVWFSPQFTDDDYCSRL